MCFSTECERRFFDLGVNLPNLQQRLLCGVIQRNDVAILSVDIGKPLIRHRLYHKKVLMSLDDVSDHQQLNALVRGPHWFGRRSRIGQNDIGDRTGRYWRSAFDFIAGCIPKDIDQKLRVSFDELDDRARDIFTVIAFVFEALLEKQMFSNEFPNKVTGPYGRIEIHNLVRLMGTNIIRPFEVVLNAITNQENTLKKEYDELKSSMQDVFQAGISHNWDLDSDGYLQTLKLPLPAD